MGWTARRVDVVLRLTVAQRQAYWVSVLDDVVVQCAC